MRLGCVRFVHAHRRTRNALSILYLALFWGGAVASHFCVAFPCVLVTYGQYAPCNGTHAPCLSCVLLCFGAVQWLRISALRFRAFWSRTASTLPATYSTRLELLASCYVFGATYLKGAIKIDNPSVLVTPSQLPLHKGAKGKSLPTVILSEAKNPSAVLVPLVKGGKREKRARGIQ